MEFVLEEGKKSNVECSTLILPALSIGNVGQLAIDLMIASKRSEKIGYLDDPNILPCIGNDAFGPIPQGDLALPLEVFQSPSNKLTFVQQRSPIVKGMMIQFAQNLASYAIASGMKHIIILSSLEFARWQTVDLSRGMPIYYLSSTNEDGSDDDCEKLGCKRLKEYYPSQKRWHYLNEIAEKNTIEENSLPFDDELESDEDYYASLPYAALFSCFKAKGLKVTCLLCYCSEGDNIPDSYNLAEATCRILGLQSSDSHASGDEGWITPLSWKSLYGPPPDMSMF